MLKLLWIVLKTNLAKSNQYLKTHCETPIISGYRSETDSLPELKSEGVTKYQNMVGLIRWGVELVWFDILLETVIMSTYLDLSRRGHPKQIFHVFGYLKVKPKRKLCFDF